MIFILFFIFTFSIDSSKLDIRGRCFTKSGCFTIFMDYNYRGNYLEICKNVTDLLSEYNFNPQNVLSIKLGHNTKLALYDDKLFKGNHTFILKNITHVNFPTTSIVINPINWDPIQQLVTSIAPTAVALEKKESSTRKFILPAISKTTIPVSNLIIPLPLTTSNTPTNNVKSTILKTKIDFPIFDISEITRPKIIKKESFNAISNPEFAFNDENKRRIGKSISSHQFKWFTNWMLPLKGDSTISFYAQALSDLIIGISSDLKVNDSMYEIVIGADVNTYSYVRAKGNQILTFPGVAIKNAKNVNRYTVKVDENDNKLTVSLFDTPLFDCIDSNFIKNLRYFSFRNGERNIYLFNVKSFPNQRLIQQTNPLIVFHSPGLESFADWKNDWTLPNKGEGSIIFSAQARNDIIVAVSDQKELTDHTYRVVIGAKKNTETIVTKGFSKTEICSTSNRILDTTKPQNYLIMFNHLKKKITIYNQGLLILECIDKDYEESVLWYNFSSLDDQVRFTYIGSLKRESTSKISAPTNNTISVAGGYNITITKPEKSTGTDQLEKYAKELNIASIVFSTKNNSLINWRPDWVLPEKGLGLILFRAEGRSEFHIILSDSMSKSQGNYEIILGDDNNLRSVVKRNGKTVCENPYPIRNIEKLNDFTIKVQHSQNKLTIYQNGLRIFRCIDPQFDKNVKWFTFASGNDLVNYFNIRKGKFRL